MSRRCQIAKPSVLLHLESWTGPPQTPNYNDLLRSSIYSNSPDEKEKGGGGSLGYWMSLKHKKFPIERSVCVTCLDHLNLMASSHLWYLISFFTSAKAGRPICMVNIWHILNYSYIMLCLRQDQLSHPAASCNICSLPLLISHQLSGVWYQTL